MSRTAASLHEAARAAIPPFHVMDLLAAAGERQRTHGDLLNLLAGQPSTPAPGPVRDAAARGARTRDVLGYTVALGHPRAARGDRRRTTGRTLRPRRSTPTTSW